MDNQHQKITGYRDLSQAEIDLMNKIKSLGQDIGQVIDELMMLQETDKRWVSIGRTDLQTGLMALTRSVAKPTSF